MTKGRGGAGHGPSSGHGKSAGQQGPATGNRSPQGKGIQPPYPPDDEEDDDNDDDD